MFKKNSSMFAIVSLFAVSALALCIHAFSYHIEISHSHNKTTIAKMVKDETLSTNISNA